MSDATTPTLAERLAPAAKGAAEQIIRRLYDEAGELAPAYAEKVRDLADAAARLAADYALGRIDDEQLEDGARALAQAAASVAAQGGLDAYQRRRDLADFGIGVLLKALVGLVTGGALL